MTLAARLLMLVAAAVVAWVLFAPRPEIYRTPARYVSQVSERGKLRVVLFTADVTKLQRCDSGKGYGAFRVRYLRKRPLWGWERSGEAFNLHNLKGQVVRARTRKAVALGQTITIRNRWAEFPSDLRRFTHFQIEVPCVRPGGDRIAALWGPARINHTEGKPYGAR